MRAGKRPGQGPPLGFLVAWMLGDEDELGCSAAEHEAFTPTFAQRREARRVLMHSDNSEWLFNLERPINNDVENCSEPETFV